MTGQVLRTRTLSTRSGRPVGIEILRPAASLESKAELVAADRRWRAEARRLSEAGQGEASRRAYFAGDVAFLAASGLSPAVQLGDNHILLARESTGGEIVGITLYRWDPVRQAWHIDLVTTNPENQLGHPSRDPVRGIGLEMVGEAVAQMNRDRCAKVELEALDAQAESFWRSRGFHDSVEPLYISCPESQELQRRLAHSEQDDPMRDEISVGRRALLRRVALPGVRY